MGRAFKVKYENVQPYVEELGADLPDEPEEYTHRVGRTARAGRTGVAVSFVTERDEERVLKIESRISA